VFAHGVRAASSVVVSDLGGVVGVGSRLRSSDLAASGGRQRGAADAERSGNAADREPVCPTGVAAFARAVVRCAVRLVSASDAAGLPVLAPPGQAIGWYADCDLALIIPHVDPHLNSGSNIKAPFLTPTTPTGSVQTGVAPGSNADVINLFGRQITLPMAPLDWVGSPFLRFGYRFADGAGDVRLDYREVASQGSSSLPQFDAAGNGALHSQLNVQYTSLTYGSSAFLTNAPQINRTWMARFGVSAADVFFNSAANGQQILLQSASNSFAGVGPTVGFSFWKPIPEWHLSLYGELDATGLVGFTRQHFAETAVIDGQTYSDFVALRRQSNGVGIFGTEGGVSFAPWDARQWRFTFGYQWQRWGWVGATNDSNAALTLQGFFFRTEWRY
jgi:hypothetical protein